MQAAYGAPIPVAVARSASTDRRQVLTDELAKARSKHEQLTSVIDYLEGELA